MKELKNKIESLKLEELKLLLIFTKEEIDNIISDELRYLSRCGKSNKISEVVFELGKNKFNLEQLKDLSEYGKIVKISEKAFELGKNKFDLKQLKYLSEYGKTDKISEDAFELLNKDKSIKFKIEDYL